MSRIDQALRALKLEKTPEPVPEVVTLDLVGVAEAATMLGIGRSALCARRSQHKNFPKPVAELACGAIWLRSQIEHYRDEEQRLGRRGWRGRRLNPPRA